MSRNTAVKPGSPNKFSALIARFNSGDQYAAAETQTSSRSPSKSPVKTPTKAMRGDGQNSTETPKESLVAPYTSNPPSASRSHKSPKPDKTPRSVRSTAGESRPRDQSNPTKPQTPKRILRDSLDDKRPMRPVSKDLETKADTPSPTKKSNPFSVSLRPISASIDGPTATLGSKKPMKEPAVQKSSNSLLEDAKISLRESVSSVQDRAEQTSNETSDQSKAKVLTAEDTDPFRSKETLLGLRASLKPFMVPHSRDGPSDLPVFDGPSGVSNTGRQLPRPDLPPVAQHLHLSRPSTAGIAADPSQKDVETKGQVLSPPPGRSTSILYNQVRTLQRQISEKSEEIHNLRHQLNARGYLDIGTLSEELRETKRELESWKARAEIAEKQVEILLKMPSRANSFKQPNVSGLKTSDKLETSIPGSRRDEAAVGNKTKKALHGLDGTQSPQRSTSEDSTDTVIRDLREAITGGDYSIYVEQTRYALIPELE